MAAIAADLPFSANAAENRPFCVNVRFAIRPEERENWKAAMKADQDGCLNDEEKGLQFIVGEDENEPNSFILHEEYLGEEGFKAHLQTPHFLKWQAFTETKPFVEGREPVVDLFYGQHEPEKKQPPVNAYGLNVDVCIKPEARTEFIPVITNNKNGATNDEKLCENFFWGESTTTENSFHFHEQYVGEDHGKEGFEAHTKSPHFARWSEFAAGDVFTQAPKIYFFKTVTL